MKNKIFEIRKKLLLLDESEERLNCLKDSFNGETVYIVGAGPSLKNHNEEELKHYESGGVEYFGDKAIYGEKDAISTSTGIIDLGRNEQEDIFPNCLNPYSLSKSFGEDLCTMYLNLYGLETVMLRYFNVYGDRQPSTGSYAPVIGIFKKQVNSGEPMTVIGDGLQTRDYVHVSDVVEANMKAASAYCSGEIFNIGTGKQTSVLDLANMIGKVKTHLPERKAEIKHSKANISKAKHLLDWAAEVKLEDWINECFSTVPNA